MTLLHDRLGAQASVDDTAVYWFTRAWSGALPAHDQHALDAWLDDDPTHRAAYDAVAATWQGIEPIRTDPRIMALREAAEARRHCANAWRARAVAAALLVAVMAGGGMAVHRFMPDPAILATQDFATGVGEKATVTLSDGSVVTLGTDTRLRTRSDPERRLLYLDRGQAFFEVARKADRPFVVHAAGRTVTALGTAFEVRIDTGFKVTLVEGKVKIKAAAAPARPSSPSPDRPAGEAPPTPQVALEETILVAGTQLVALDDQHWSVSRTDVTREVSWVKGQLVYVDEPLGKVAAEMNRYSDRKIAIADPAAAAILISGTFKAGDVEAFVRAVEAYKLVRVTAEAPTVVRLASRE